MLPLYETEGDAGQVVRVHYFPYVSRKDWHRTEYNRETGKTFGLVRGFGVE